MEAPPPPITFRYLARFRCIGGACEDSCCSHWRIELDDETRARLAALEGDAAVHRALGTLDEMGTPRGEAARRFLPQTPDRDCVFLDEERLCAVQRRHGEEALPLVCTMFPRHTGLVQGRLELTATVACPEVARLVLLPEDAMELDEAPAAVPPRLHLLQSIEAGEAHPYRRHFPLVRSVLLELLTREQHTIDERLFFIAYLAASIHPFYRADTPPDAAFPDDALHHQVGLILHPDAQRHLAGELGAVPFDPSVARVVLETVSVLARAASPRLRSLLTAALADCRVEDGDRALRLDGADELRVTVDRVAAIHHERRGQLPAACAARFDAAIARYFLNLIVQSWFVDRSDLFLHHKALLVRLALIRFLVLGQPGIAAGGAALDGAIVAVFSTVTRAFDHDLALSEALGEAIKAMGASSPLHAARLLKF